MANAKVKTVASFDDKNPQVLKVEWKDGENSFYTFSDVPENIRVQAAHHGFTQKLMDAHSGLGEGGVAACREATQIVWESLLEGSWNLGRGSIGGFVVEAISEIWKISLEDAKERFDALDDDTKKEVAKDPQVVEWKAKRDLARAKAKVKGTEVDMVSKFFLKEEASE